MATNPPTVKALKRMTELIDEVYAWNRMLKKHVGQQQRQPNQFEGDEYKYNSKNKKIERIRDGKVKSRY